MTRVDAIKFRMYHTGSVGDCLLLLFMKAGQISFSMLIDCGGWLTSPAAITACVSDIRTTCDGKLDLLVVTHQHMDHISGFNQARAEFDQITVKEVWLSWIEDESDEIGQILRKQYGKTLKALKATTTKALAKLSAQEHKMRGVRGVNKRSGEKQEKLKQALALVEFEEGMMGADGKLSARPTNDAAMKYIKAKGKKLRYCLPGEVVKSLSGAEGLKFYFLGPPRDADMRFFKIYEDKEEMYQLVKGAIENKEPINLEEPIIETGIILQDGMSPFQEQYHTGASIKFSDPKEKDDYSWRGIETDWLETAAAIAMRATRLTNNTSLAFAIEFEDSERVVLFPGDAQSGNWMGWHKPDVTKALKLKGGKNTEELLHQTVFYKVGHHGSHNGTASVSGLDMMNHKDLVAFMPLVLEKVPDEWGGSANFPAKKLYKVLKEKTRGRIVRTDIGLIDDAKALEERKKLSPKEKGELKKSLTQGTNYFEYTIRG